MLDHYIKSGKLSQFIRFLFEEKVREKKKENEQKSWELWLHKVFDKSYGEFIESLRYEEDARKKAAEIVDIEKAVDAAINTINFLGGDAP